MLDTKEKTFDFSNVLLVTRRSLDYAVGGGRTHTPLRELDFESSASAYSATTAWLLLDKTWGLLGNPKISDAVGGGRTHTPLRELDFESSASAYSATTAYLILIGW